jgi:hypothetical protein
MPQQFVPEVLVSVDDALRQISEMIFPEVKEGDIASHAGHQFIYQGGLWTVKSE